MYGMQAAGAASGGALVYTGVNVGADLLTAIGVLMVGLALLALARRTKGARP